MTSIKYENLRVMGTITGKFHQNPLKTVGGVAEAACLRTDGRTNPLLLSPVGGQKIRSFMSIFFPLRVDFSEGFWSSENQSGIYRSHLPLKHESVPIHRKTVLMVSLEYEINLSGFACFYTSLS